MCCLFSLFSPCPRGIWGVTICNGQPISYTQFYTLGSWEAWDRVNAMHWQQFCGTSNNLDSFPKMFGLSAAISGSSQTWPAVASEQNLKKSDLRKVLKQKYIYSFYFPGTQICMQNCSASSANHRNQTLYFLNWWWHTYLWSFNCRLLARLKNINEVNNWSCLRLKLCFIVSVVPQWRWWWIEML